MSEGSIRSKAVLVTTEVPVQTGGIGTFVWNFAKLLKAQGHDVLVILANPTQFPRSVWAKPFDEAGIQTDYVFKGQFDVPEGYSWLRRISEKVASMIPDDADVVYLADWQAKGFDYVRQRRFSAQPGPAIVTVLHGSTRWLREGMRTAPQGDHELYLDAAEAYCAQHGDYVVSPGEYMLSWVRSAGWKVPAGAFSRVVNSPFFPQHLQRASLPSAQSAAQPTSIQIATAHTQSAASESHAHIGQAASQSAAATTERSESALAANPTPAVPSPSTAAAHDYPAPTQAASPQRGAFRRIVFFGRIETRKGIELFVNGLSKLKGKPCLDGIEEIVLLGGPSRNPIGTPDKVAAEISRRLLDKTPATTRGRAPGKPAAIKVQAITTYNTVQAQQYLAERASDTLVIMPSVRENFPLSVIETSLIPGLNIIASTAGSTGEILGPRGSDHLFEPFLTPFAQKLEETLLAGPKADDELGHYDWARANADWIAFHEEATTFARERAQAAREQAPAHPAVATDRSVDVCVSYYNLGDYLPYMLKSLERQTEQDFNVIVINDGSTDPHSIQVFEEQAAHYADRGWRFITTPNGGLSAARNAAAAAGTGRYLIFVDGDDVVAPTLVERFRSAIEISGDDCLSCNLHLFRGEGWNDAYARPSSAIFSYVPSGPDPVLGLVSNSFGGACCIVKREAFEAISGFTTDISRYVGYEDYEFYLRLMLDGFKLDVVPEFLLYYRVRDDGMLRTGDVHENQARILRTYERRLQELGFPGLASFAESLFRHGSNSSNSPQINAANIDPAFLVFNVSGHILWKALLLKIRNQIAKLLGHPARSW